MTGIGEWHANAAHPYITHLYCKNNHGMAWLGLKCIIHHLVSASSSHRGQNIDASKPMQQLLSHAVIAAIFGLIGFVMGRGDNLGSTFPLVNF